MSDDTDNEAPTPLKTALFESVRKRLATYGFELHLGNHKFVRRHDGITDVFQLPCKDAKPGYRVQPNVGVRIDLVEEIFHQTSGFEPKFRDGTSTMGNSVGSLIGKSSRDCEFLVETDADVPAVTEKVIEVFRDFAIPYFNKWRSLQAIDAELNDDPASKTKHRGLAWFRCSTGLIVARLLGRTDYEKLAEIYTEIMTKDNKGFYLKWFLPLRKSLEEIELGSGIKL
jgi:hypothetical protein